MVLNTPIVKQGKLMKVGSSIVIAVPPEWLEDKKLEAGQDIIIVANGNLTIMKNDTENRNKLTQHIYHATRLDEDTKGENSSPSKSDR